MYHVQSTMTNLTNFNQPHVHCTLYIVHKYNKSYERYNSKNPDRR